MCLSPKVAPSDRRQFALLCGAERNSARDDTEGRASSLLFEAELLSDGRGGIADLVDGLLKVFPRDAQMPAPVPDLVRLLHVDLAAICRFFPGEAAHIGILSVGCQNKAHFKRNNFKSKKNSSAFSGGQMRWSREDGVIRDTICLIFPVEIRS
jgi:hypothetical protein